MEITDGVRKELKEIEREVNSLKDEIHRLRAENNQLSKFKERFEQIQQALKNG